MTPRPVLAPIDPLQRAGSGLRKTVAGRQMPVDFLLSVMRDTTYTLNQRMTAAKYAAPYCHAALNKVDIDAKVTHGVSAELRALLADNAGAARSRSFLDFGREDRDAPPPADERPLPHH